MASQTALSNSEIVDSDRLGGQPSRVTPVAWVPTRKMSLAEWAAMGRRLGAAGRYGQWAMGDWLRYGNTRFGERYVRAARITGYDPQTLMNMAYVASKFEIPRRREGLSWSHHEALASLEPDEQEHWFDRVTIEKLSVSDLRLELRNVRRGWTPDVDKTNEASAVPAGEDSLMCPKCGRLVAETRALSAQRDVV